MEEGVGVNVVGRTLVPTMTSNDRWNTCQDVINIASLRTVLSYGLITSELHVWFHKIYTLLSRRVGRLHRLLLHFSLSLPFSLLRLEASRRSADSGSGCYRWWRPIAADNRTASVVRMMDLGGVMLPTARVLVANGLTAAAGRHHTLRSANRIGEWHRHRCRCRRRWRVGPQTARIARLNFHHLRRNNNNNDVSNCK